MNCQMFSWLLSSGERGGSRKPPKLATRIEHFQAKWEPVRRPEMRQLKEIERFRDSTQTESALSPSAPQSLGPWQTILRLPP
jgi:hypothetical protein